MSEAKKSWSFKDGKFITPIVTISFPHIFPETAQTNSKGNPRFSAAFLIHKGDEDFVQALAQELKATATLKFGLKAEDMIRKGTLKWPIKTNRDQFRDEYPEDVIAVINVSANSAPGVVGVEPSPEDVKKPRKITDYREVYAGSKGRASIRPFAYDNDAKGVSVGLNNYQKVGEGERLDGRASAEDEFDADLSAAPSSLSDLGL
jgi:hypothetical protein